MALRDVTADGVKRAMAQFDQLGREAFLARFGFGRARHFFLVHGGHHYDSKAVVGVAHLYDRPDLGALLSRDFSGGEARVASRLESLGFEVQRLPRNPPWAAEELILALDLYLRAGPLDHGEEAVTDLSRDLNALTVHSERPDPARFRNPNSVALKLANFAALDPNYAGRGLTRGGRRDFEVWDRYASDEDALAEAAAAIRDRQEPPAMHTREHLQIQVIEADLEAQHVERFQVSVPDQVVDLGRREQTLVLAYRDHLESLGHRVTRHFYSLPGSESPLACDIVDETDQVLYEAKGDVRRSSVRMAIGQLFDYCRFEPTPMSIELLNESHNESPICL